MHSHAGPLSGRGKGQVIPDSQLVDAVSGFMDDGKQGTVHAVRVVCGDAHILIVQVGGKRMGADSHDTAVKIKAHIPCQETGQLLLLFLRVIPFQETILNLLSFLHYLFEERNQFLFQESEEFIQVLHGEALLIIIQHDVVGLFPVLCPVVCKLFLEPDYLFKGWGKCLKVLVFLGPGPHAGGPGRQTGKFLVLLLGNADGLLQFL